MALLRKLLRHPLTRGMDLDDPETTLLRRKIIQEMPLLRNIYEEWYGLIRKHLPFADGPVLEIGSGPGFLKDYVPGLITSDLMPVAGNTLALDAMKLPFQSQALQAIVLVNVLHHIEDPALFFSEARRCIKPGGPVIMIEPWVSAWSRVVYSTFHHEPFDCSSPDWVLPQNGPLSGGNDALPWIIFGRDRQIFEDRTGWRIRLVQEIMPFRYLLSGGLTTRNLMPAWTNRPLSRLERSMPRWMIENSAMFAVIVLQ